MIQKDEFTLANLVNKAARSLMKAYQNRILSLGITPPQYGILWVLSLKGSIPQVEIARSLFLDKANVNAMVKKLSTSGMININSSEQDKRSTLVSITPKGISVLKKARKEDCLLSDHISELIDDPAHIEIIRNFLFKIIESGSDE